MLLSDWYKNNDTDLIWWRDALDEDGYFLFSFDQETTYNLFEDYHKLTDEQRAIFNKENPEWAQFFGERGN